MTVETAPELLTLGERHSIPILLFLYENDGCQKINIYQNVVRNYTGLNRLNSMIDSGLVFEEKTNRGNYIHLTENGRRIARILKTLNDELLAE